MNYGLPYMGSKNKIVDEVVDVFPRAKHFYDLFAGGCSVTHYLMQGRKFQHYHVNDIQDTPRLFVDAVNGRYRDERRWIDRATFSKEKDTDPYVRTVWSFGNRGQGYLYSKEVEPWKKALHYARVLGDASLLKEFGIDGSGSYRDVKEHHGEYKDKYCRWYMREVLMSGEDYDRLKANLEADIAHNQEKLCGYLLAALKDCGLTQAEVQRRLGTQMAGHYFGRSQWGFPTKEMYDKMRKFLPLLDKSYEGIYGLQELLQSLQSLQRLERLGRLQRLQSLERLQSLTVTVGDYQAVKIEPDSVIYCDIPYRGTCTYTDTPFDYERFYDWACTQSVPVYVSEYSMPEDRFECVREIKHRSRLSGVANNAVTERIYIPRGQKARPARQLSLF